MLPPDFVTVLMTPPTNLPYSAEIAEVVVVVSWTASSMYRFVDVFRMLSVMTTPLTM